MSSPGSAEPQGTPAVSRPGPDGGDLARPVAVKVPHQTRGRPQGTCPQEDHRVLQRDATSGANSTGPLGPPQGPPSICKIIAGHCGPIMQQPEI